MRLNTALVLIASVVSAANAFQIQKQHVSTPTHLFSTTASGLLSLERNVQREIDQFQGWAGQCGVSAENGFFFEGQMVDGNEDYYAATGTGAAAGSRMLYVPGEMILSSNLIAQEYQGYVDASLQVLAEMKMQHLNKEFYLFVKVLLEYEQGQQSPYFPWLAALPRKWNTAASMAEQDQLAAFRKALNAFEYLSPESKANSELMKFAYNVVFTRSTTSEDGDKKIVPVADMLNHGYPDNVAITYDANGGCEVYAKEDVAAGSALTISYGDAANPSRFLATYGFLNDAPAAFCKLVFSNPSPKLLDIGYDPNRMLFYTADGSISQEVWDVLLYSRLERKPELASEADRFYQAHMNGDEETKKAIHNQYNRDTVGALLRHMNHILSEVAELTVMMNAYDSSKHPRLPLLKKHHAMVTSTFTKARDYLMESLYV